MNKRTKTLAIIVGVVFGGVILFNIAKKIIVSYLFATYVPPAVSVSSVTVKEESWHPFITTIGTFVAKNGTNVTSQSPGQITKIHFKSGQQIHAGQALVDLNDTVEQADLKLNESDLKLQRSEYNRQKQLHQQNATSSSNLDQAENRFLQAEARVEKIKALIQQKHISAPFTGRLGIRKVNLGQYLKPGETGIVSLQSLDPIFIKFSVPEQMLNKIYLNQIINFKVEQYPGIIFKGKIHAINSQSDSATHNIEVQARVSNCPATELKYPSKSPLITTKTASSTNEKIIDCSSKINHASNIERFAFVPGMFADIKIMQPVVKNNLVIPSTAISYSMYGDAVFVIEKDQLKNQEILRVKKVFVKLGAEQGNLTAIKQGLKAGQMVVSSGEFKLEDGTQVTINNDVKLPSLENTNKLGR